MSLEDKIVRRQRVIKNILVVDYEQYEKLPVIIPTVDKVTMVLIDLMKYICTTRFGSNELLSLEEFDKQFERVKQLCPNVEFKHVKGHSGDKWNERADKLAVAASQKL